MKRLLILFLLLTTTAHAGTTTDNLGLYKPTPGVEEDWGEEINNNWDEIDEKYDIEDCDDPLEDKVVWDANTKTFSCEPDQTSGGWAEENGLTYIADPLHRVGIGTFEPNANLEVAEGGEASFPEQTRINGALVCLEDGSNCPIATFFDTTIQEDLTWSNGDEFTWTMNAGATDPLLTFGNGTLDIEDAAVTVHGTTSQVKFANNIYINGDTARKLKIGSTGGSNNETLYIDNDLTANKVLVTTDSGVTNIDFDTMALLNTSAINRFGGLTVGTTSASGCIVQRDTDNAGWTECCTLDGYQYCGIDADGNPDGTL